MRDTILAVATRSLWAYGRLVERGRLVAVGDIPGAENLLLCGVLFPLYSYPDTMLACPHCGGDFFDQPYLDEHQRQRHSTEEMPDGHP